MAILEIAMPFLKRSLAMEIITVVRVEDAQVGSIGFDAVPVEKSEPGAPGIVFYNLE